MTDFFSTTNLFLPFMFAFIVSVGFGNLATQMAERLNILDIPNSAPHKKHIRPMPLAGGFLIFLTLIPALFIFQNRLHQNFLVVFSGSFIVFLFGVWDDAKGLSAFPKLIGQCLAASVLILFGVQVQFMTYFAQIGYISIPLAEFLNLFITFFWLIGITNAFNMIDSMDGIVAGLASIATAFFMIATILSRQSTLAFWLAIFLGINLALYFWNGIKSRFFLGDSGAQTIGFLLASFAILYNPLNRNPESSWIVPIMLLGIPIFDTTLVVLSRFKRKQKIGTGRRDHTYHRLIALSLSPKYAVIFTHTTALIISCLAYFTLLLTPLLALTFFIITIFCGMIVLLWLERQPTLDE